MSLLEGLRDFVCDTIVDALDHVADTIDVTLGDPEEEGLKRGYEKAAQEFEPIAGKIEREYHEVIASISDTKTSYGNQANRLLEKIKELEAEKERLESIRNECAQSSGISVASLCCCASNPSSIISNPNLNLGGLIIDARIAKMKKAERQAYAEACEKFQAKIQQMRNRLAECKRKANEILKESISLIEACLSEIENLQIQIITTKVLR